MNTLEFCRLQLFKRLLLYSARGRSPSDYSTFLTAHPHIRKYVRAVSYRHPVWLKEEERPMKYLLSLPNVWRFTVWNTNLETLQRLGRAIHRIKHIYLYDCRIGSGALNRLLESARSIEALGLIGPCEFIEEMSITPEIGNRGAQLKELFFDLQGVGNASDPPFIDWFIGTKPSNLLTLHISAAYQNFKGIGTLLRACGRLEEFECTFLGMLLFYTTRFCPMTPRAGASLIGYIDLSQCKLLIEVRVRCHESSIAAMIKTYRSVHAVAPMRLFVEVILDDGRRLMQLWHLLRCVHEKGEIAMTTLHVSQMSLVNLAGVSEEYEDYFLVNEENGNVKFCYPAIQSS